MDFLIVQNTIEQHMYALQKGITYAYFYKILFYTGSIFYGFFMEIIEDTCYYKCFHFIEIIMYGLIVHYAYMFAFVHVEVDLDLYNVVQLRILLRILPYSFSYCTFGRDRIFKQCPHNTVCIFLQGT